MFAKLPHLSEIRAPSFCFYVKAYVMMKWILKEGASKWELTYT